MGTGVRMKEDRQKDTDLFHSPFMNIAPKHVQEHCTKIIITRYLALLNLFESCVECIELLLKLDINH